MLLKRGYITRDSLRADCWQTDGQQLRSVWRGQRSKVTPVSLLRADIQRSLIDTYDDTDQLEVANQPGWYQVYCTHCMSILVLFSFLKLLLYIRFFFSSSDSVWKQNALSKVKYANPKKNGPSLRASKTKVKFGDCDDSSWFVLENRLVKVINHKWKLMMKINGLLKRLESRFSWKAERKHLGRHKTNRKQTFEWTLRCERNPRWKAV